MRKQLTLFLLLILLIEVELSQLNMFSGSLNQEIDSNELDSIYKLALKRQLVNRKRNLFIIIYFCLLFEAL